MWNVSTSPSIQCSSSWPSSAGSSPPPSPDGIPLRSCDTPLNKLTISIKRLTNARVPSMSADATLGGFPTVIFLRCLIGLSFRSLILANELLTPRRRSRAGHSNFAGEVYFRPSEPSCLIIAMSKNDAGDTLSNWRAQKRPLSKEVSLSLHTLDSDGFLIGCVRHGTCAQYSSVLIAAISAISASICDS